MIEQQPPRWQTWVHPNVSWMESFVQRFVSPDIVMWPEETDAVPAWYSWTSHHFDDIADSGLLSDRIAALKAVFDGAMMLAMGPSYHRFQLTDLKADKDEDKKHITGFEFEGDVTVYPFSGKHLYARHGLKDDYLDDPMTRNVFLSRYDEISLSILKYTGVQGLSYLTLYAYRDWMKDGGWDDQRIAEKAGWSKSQLKDFTNTANNPAYLGPYCRHGGFLKAAPPRPMSLEDSDAGMRKAMNAFLLERATSVKLRDRWNELR